MSREEQQVEPLVEDDDHESVASDDSAEAGAAAAPERSVHLLGDVAGVGLDAPLASTIPTTTTSRAGAMDYKHALKALETVPVFSGDDCDLPLDFNAWAHLVQSRLGSLDFSDAVRLVPMRLTGQAADLFDITKETLGLLSLTGIFAAMRASYEPFDLFDPMDVLLKLKQKDSERVLNFKHRVKVQTDVYKVDLDSAPGKRVFLLGLRPSLYASVMAMLSTKANDTSFAAIFDIAVMLEARSAPLASAPVARVAAVSHTPLVSASPSVAAAAAAPPNHEELESHISRLVVAAIREHVPPAVARAPRTPFQPRSAVECYYCHNLGHIARDCRKKARADRHHQDTTAGDTKKPGSAQAAGSGGKGPNSAYPLVSVVSHQGALTCNLLFSRSGSLAPIPVVALVDTGSAVSIISSSLFASLGPLESVPTETVAPDCKFVSASGDSLVPLAHVPLPFALQDCVSLDAQSPTSSCCAVTDSALFSFYIVADVHPSCILGADFLQHFQSVITCNSAGLSLSLSISSRQWSVVLSRGERAMFDAAYAVRRRLDIERMGPLRDIAPGVQVLLPPAESSDKSPDELLAMEVQCVPSLSESTNWKIDVEKSIEDILSSLPRSSLSQASIVQFTALARHDLFLASRPLSVKRDETATKLPFKMHIRLSDQAVPKNSAPYRLAEPANRSLEKQLSELLEMGFVRPSQSAWAHPCIMVPKGGGEYRMCVDLRGVNAYTIKDSYALPRMDDVIDRLANSRFYAHLDLKSGYWQVKIDKASRQYTAFTTPWRGLYEWVRLAFGLKNAPALFQRTMETVLKGLLGIHCLVYLDDIVVFGATESEYLDSLAAVLQRLRFYDLRVNLPKCKFFVTQFIYLGHEISATGIRPDPEKVAPLLNFPAPFDAEHLSKFLGLCGWYRRFVPNFSSLAAPLHKMMHADQRLSPNSKLVVWSPEAQYSFDTIKKVLTTRPVMAYPDLHNLQKPYFLYTDASGIALGAVLMQESNRDHLQHPVAFFSCALVEYERNYSNPEREALAVLRALRHFRPYLEGRRINVYTDCQAVAAFFANAKDSSNTRLVRWSLEVSIFDVALRHISGQANPAADALSRYVQNHSRWTLPLPTNPPVSHHLADYVNAVSFLVAPVGAASSPLVAARVDNIIKLQLADDECKQLCDRLRSADPDPTLGHFFLRADGALFHRRKLRATVEPIFLDEDSPQVFVPTPLRAGLVKMAHESAFYGAHSGYKTVLLHLRRYYYWPAMKSDILSFTKDCRVCAAHSGDAHHGPFALTPNPSRPFARIAVDTVGPLRETASGNKYILVAVDMFTRWPIAVACKAADSKSFLRFLMDDIICNFGPPDEILTDNGSQFTSQVSLDALQALGIGAHRTSGYRPNANGMCERMNKSIIERLSKACSGQPLIWDQWLPQVVWAMRAKCASATQMSPFELLYGRAPRLPGDPVPLLPPPSDDHYTEKPVTEYVKDMMWRLGKAYAAAHENSKDAKESALRAANEHRSGLRSFVVGDIVRYRAQVAPKLDPKWKGPYRITAKVGPVNYSIIGLEGAIKGETRLEHVDNLDRFTPSLLQQADPLEASGSRQEFASSSSRTFSPNGPQPVERQHSLTRRTSLLDSLPLPLSLQDEGENCQGSVRKSARLRDQERRNQQEILASFSAKLFPDASANLDKPSL